MNVKPGNRHHMSFSDVDGSHLKTVDCVLITECVCVCRMYIIICPLEMQVYTYKLRTCYLCACVHGCLYVCVYACACVCYTCIWVYMCVSMYISALMAPYTESHESFDERISERDNTGTFDLRNVQYI